MDELREYIQDREAPKDAPVPSMALEYMNMVERSFDDGPADAFGSKLREGLIRHDPAAEGDDLEVSLPVGFKQGLHVGVNPETGEFEGMPLEWLTDASILPSPLGPITYDRGKKTGTTKGVPRSTSSRTRPLEKRHYMKEKLQTVQKTLGRRGTEAETEREGIRKYQHTQGRIGPDEGKVGPLSQSPPSTKRQPLISNVLGGTDAVVARARGAIGNKDKERGKPEIKPQDVEVSRPVARRVAPQGVASSPSGKEFNLDDRVGGYVLGKMLGKGGFGRVHMGFDTRTARIVAVKRYDMNYLATEASLAHTKLLAEVDLMKSLNHANIIEFIGYETIDNLMFLFLEFAEAGSLLSLVKRYGCFEEKLVAHVTEQTLKGLAYLHSLDIVHRDIKADNVLLTKNGEVKLADFGLSVSLEGDRVKRYSMVGTPFWMAPEVLNATGHGIPSDVWSLACMTHEMLTKRPPYYTKHPLTAMHLISADPHPPLPQRHCHDGSKRPISRELRAFFLLCWRKNPEERPSAEELLGHPWVTNPPQHNAAANDEHEESFSPKWKSSHQKENLMRAWEAEVEDTRIAREEWTKGPPTTPNLKIEYKLFMKRRFDAEQRMLASRKLKREILRRKPSASELSAEGDNVERSAEAASADVAEESCVEQNLADADALLSSESGVGGPSLDDGTGCWVGDGGKSEITQGHNETDTHERERKSKQIELLLGTGPVNEDEVSYGELQELLLMTRIDMNRMRKQMVQMEEQLYKAQDEREKYKEYLVHLSQRYKQLLSYPEKTAREGGSPIERVGGAGTRCGSPRGERGVSASERGRGGGGVPGGRPLARGMQEASGIPRGERGLLAGRGRAHERSFSQPGLSPPLPPLAASSDQAPGALREAPASADCSSVLDFVSATRLKELCATTAAAADSILAFARSVSADPSSLDPDGMKKLLQDLTSETKELLTSLKVIPQIESSLSVALLQASRSVLIQSNGVIQGKSFGHKLVLSAQKYISAVQSIKSALGD